MMRVRRTHLLAFITALGLAAVVLCSVVLTRQSRGLGMLLLLLTSMVLYLVRVQKPTDEMTSFERWQGFATLTLLPATALVYGSQSGFAVLCLCGSLLGNLKRLVLERTELAAWMGLARVATWTLAVVLTIQLHQRYLEQARGRADRLVVAIEAYRARTGTYPNTLDAIDPAWTKPGADPRFRYETRDTSAMLRYATGEGMFGACMYPFKIHRWICRK